MDKTEIARFIGIPKAFLLCLLVLSILLSACASQPPQPAAPTAPVQSTATTQPAATAAPTQTPSATPQPTPVEPTRTAVPPTVVASCTPTPPDMEGPFYEPNAPHRSSVGKGHVLTGVVRSARNCAPIANAQVEFWMANPNGDYDDDHRATLFSDSSGAYKFESNLPPPYSGRPPHIHIRVTAQDYQTLITQYYPAQGQTQGTLNLVLVSSASSAAPKIQVQEYPVPRGSHPHDVAPAPDGSVWYTAQASGELGKLDPATGQTHHIKLGQGSAPHGVIVGPDGAPWITDGGLNAIVRVDPKTEEVKRFPLPSDRGNVSLNTATFDRRGVLWFTGQTGVYGRLDLATGKVEVFDAPRGRGPYGIATTPDGTVYYASLARERSTNPRAHE